MTVAMSAPQTASAGPAVRGTQSFVGVMAEVWKRPSLTALEVAWRWAFWFVSFGAAAVHWRPVLQPVAAVIQANGWAAVGSIKSTSFSLSSQVSGSSLRWITLQIGVACLGWIALSAWGRGRVLERLSSGVRPAFTSLLVISALRVFSLVLVLACWARAVVALTRMLIFLPQSQYREPEFVPFAAIVICGTLALFVLWMAASSFFNLLLCCALNSKPGRASP